MTHRDSVDRIPKRFRDRGDLLAPHQPVHRVIGADMVIARAVDSTEDDLVHGSAPRDRLEGLVAASSAPWQSPYQRTIARWPGLLQRVAWQQTLTHIANEACLQMRVLVPMLPKNRHIGTFFVFRASVARG